MEFCIYSIFDCMTNLKKNKQYLTDVKEVFKQHTSTNWLQNKLLQV